MEQSNTSRAKRRAEAKQQLEQTARLTDLLDRLDSERDRERKQLSHELHDTLLSMLSASKLECDWLLRRKTRGGDTEYLTRLSRVSGSLSEAIEFTRGVIGALWPSVVQHLGLVAAIQGHIAELRARSAVEIEAQVQGDLDTLPEAHVMTLYRAVREALDRPMADPTLPCRVELALRRGNRGVDLHVAVPKDGQNKNLVLSRLEGDLTRERVRRLRGECSLSDDGNGNFHLRLFLPLPSRLAKGPRAS